MTCLLVSCVLVLVADPQPRSVTINVPVDRCSESQRITSRTGRVTLSVQASADDGKDVIGMIDYRDGSKGRIFQMFYNSIEFTLPDCKGDISIQVLNYKNPTRKVTVTFVEGRMGALPPRPLTDREKALANRLKENEREQRRRNAEDREFDRSMDELRKQAPQLPPK